MRFATFKLATMRWMEKDGVSMGETRLRADLVTQVRTLQPDLRGVYDGDVSELVLSGERYGVSGVCVVGKPEDVERALKEAT
jgi:hypothetical protein